MTCTAFKEDLSVGVRKALAGISFGFVAILVTSTAILMCLAIWKLHKVAKASFAGKLNPCLTGLYIFCTLVWASTWFSMIVIYFVFIGDLQNYTHSRVDTTLY